uniref:Uncharacterized protein n=1 Tax=Opuntia streptacantha TaxID=393608 RepID=A0A7C9D7P4_OPUST
MPQICWIMLQLSRCGISIIFDNVQCSISIEHSNMLGCLNLICHPVPSLLKFRGTVVFQVIQAMILSTNPFDFEAYTILYHTATIIEDDSDLTILGQFGDRQQVILKARHT